MQRHRQQPFHASLTKPTKEAMSKRKRDWGGHEIEDHSEPKEIKRRKRERRAAADTKGTVKHETSLQLVNGPAAENTGIVQPMPVRRLSHGRRKGGERKRRTKDVSKSAAANDIATREGDLEKQEKRRERKKVKKERKRPQWNVSDPVGGQMLNIDPLFSLNEELVVRFT